MTPCYIFDVDGTIADCSHRLVHLEKTPKDWKAFNAGISDDKPIEHILYLLSQLSGETDCILMTGRSEDMRVATVEWLTAQDLGAPPFGGYTGLYMRPAGDYRDDAIVKLELLAKVRADGYEPIMAFDDRDRVVKMWRENGVPCAQVAPGDF
jgi:hypothetical protein